MPKGVNSSRMTERWTQYSHRDVSSASKNSSRLTDLYSSEPVDSLTTSCSRLPQDFCVLSARLL